MATSEALEARVRAGSVRLETYAPRDRPEAWRLIAAPLCEVSDLPVEFVASGDAFYLGPMTLTDSTHPQQTFTRTAEKLRRDGTAVFMCSVELTGDYSFAVDSLEGHVGAGRATLWDIGQTSVKRQTSGRTLCCTIERELLEEVLPGAAQLHGLPLGPLSALLAEHLRSLCGYLPTAPAGSAAQLVRSTAHLIAACGLPTADTLDQARPVLSAALLSRAQRHIRVNRGRTDLSPDRLAQELGVSRTSLYRAFESEGGVSEAIRNARLAAAYDALTDAGDIRRISEIAYACGFRSEAQFSRAIRRRYGAAPSELRRESAVRPLRRPELIH